MAFSDFLSPILSPLLESTGPFWTILIVSLFVSLLTTIVYKYTTDQTKLRKLKADLKRYQKKAQKIQKEDPKKALELQKDMMKLNGQYMKQSFRSTLYTFLPVILFFGWLSAFLSFAPLAPGSAFDVTVQTVEGTAGNLTLLLPDGFSTNGNLSKTINSDGVVSWRLSAQAEGSYDILIRHSEGEEYVVPLEITTKQGRADPLIVVNGVALDTITVGYPELDVFAGVFFFEAIPWVKTWGWLGAYILFSLIFSMSLRRLMKLA